MYHLPKRLSRNSKTGRMPVSTSGAETCPETCPLKEDGGCFGKNYHLAMHWRKVTEGDSRAVDWSTVLQSVRGIAAGTLWRHNQVGDLPGVNLEIDGPKMFDLIRANLGKQGFTYTHKPVLHSEKIDRSIVEDNRLLIWVANQNGFAVNLSGDNPRHTDQLVDLGIAPVVSILPLGETRKRFKSPAGNTVLRCPAEYVEDLTCKSCGLCAEISRSFAVGFTVHGSSKAAANLVALS